MRQDRTVQATIFEVFAGHEIGCELKANLAVAGSAARAGEPGGRRFASPRIARDRTPRPAGGGAALCAAQATAAIVLRRTGLSP
jgi:hypothetical protein